MTADFIAHGATLTLAWFVAINAAACAVAAVTAIAVERAAAESSWMRSPRLWIALRLAPSAAAAFFVLAFFVPSYLQYEPREGVEGFDLTLTLAAVAGGAILAAGAARGGTAWPAAQRRIRVWMRHAQPMTIRGTDLPAYAIDAEQPMIALVGV